MNAQGIANIEGATGGRGMAAPWFWLQWVVTNILGGIAALSMAAEFPWSVGVFPSGDPANVAGYGVG